MSITNQQIADLINNAIEAMERIVIEMAKTNRELAAKNEAEHDEFRRALIETSETLVLLRERQDRHAMNWQTLWKIAIVPVLLAVIGAVIALVLK